VSPPVTRMMFWCDGLVLRVLQAGFIMCHCLLPVFVACEVLATAFFGKMSFFFPFSCVIQRGAISRIVEERKGNLFKQGEMTMIVPDPTENLESSPLGGRFRLCFLHFLCWVDEIKSFSPISSV
jgi:hypothetical protein